MSLFRHRPLFLCACLFLCASVAGFLLPTLPKLILAATAATAALPLGVLLIRRHMGAKSKYLCGVTLASVLCIATALLSSYVTFDLRAATLAPYIREQNEVEVSATVCEQGAENSSFSTYVLDVDTVDGATFSGKAYLTCYYAADLSPGDEITLTLPVCEATEAAGSIYLPHQLLSDGIFFGMISETENQLTVTGQSHSLLYAMTEHRADTVARLGVALGKDTAGIPAALLLGERGMLSQTTVRDFSRCGVSHLLAISGLHMTVLFGGLAWLLRRLGLSSKGRAVVLCLLSLTYLLYLGFPASATRATVMLGYTYLSTVLSLRTDLPTSLGTAGMGIVFFSPTAVADIGFWLSFSSVLGILLLLPAVDKASSSHTVGGRILRKLRQTGKGLWTGVAAVSASLWVIAPMIGELSPFSAPVTLLLTPAVGALLFLTLVYLLLLSSPLGIWIAVPIRGIVLLLERICAELGDLPFAVVSVRGVWVSALSFLMLGGTLLLAGMRLPRAKLWLISTPALVGWASIALCLVVGQAMTHTHITAHMITPSATSEMVIYTHGSEAVICDFSNGSETSLRAAATHAASRGATEISALVLTHHHTASSGSLLRILESEKVRALWLPRPLNEEDGDAFAACREKAEQTGTPVFIYDYSQPLSLTEGSTLTVYCAYIPRSVQPALLATLSTEADTVTYCGGGVLESDLRPTAEHILGGSTAVFFGRHGPKIKDSPSKLLCPVAETAVFSDTGVAAQLIASCRQEAVLTVGDGSVILPLSSP